MAGGGGWREAAGGGGLAGGGGRCEAAGDDTAEPLVGPYFDCEACEWFGATLQDAVVTHFRVAARGPEA